MTTLRGDLHCHPFSILREVECLVTESALEVVALNNNPWDRQPGESPDSYDRFLVYLDFPRGDDFEALAIEAHWPTKALKTLAAKYKWRERRAAHRAFLQQKQLEVISTRQQEEMALREEAVSKQRQRDMRLADRLYDKVMQMLDLPLTTEQIIEDGGKTIIIRQPLKWKGADIATFAKVASDLAHRALGNSQSIDSTVITKEVKTLAVQSGVDEQVLMQEITVMAERWLKESAQ
jgi:hypothetical protein